MSVADPERDPLAGLDLPRFPRIPVELLHYTVAEVAHAFRCSPSTVYRWQEKGLRIITDGGLTLIEHLELVRFKQKRFVELRRGGGRQPRRDRTAH